MFSTIKAELLSSFFFFFFCLWQLIFFLPGIWCSPMPRCRPTDFTEFTVNMESMARQHKAKRFLSITENLSGEFSLSFTGSRGATGTSEMTDIYSILIMHKVVMSWFDNLKNFIQTFQVQKRLRLESPSLNVILYRPCSFFLPPCLLMFDYFNKLKFSKSPQVKGKFY